MTAGEYLKTLMRGHGLSSRRLAERTDGEVAESTIRNYLADKGVPRAEKAPVSYTHLTLPTIYSV